MGIFTRFNKMKNIHNIGSYLLWMALNQLNSLCGVTLIKFNVLMTTCHFQCTSFLLLKVVSVQRDLGNQSYKEMKVDTV